MDQHFVVEVTERVDPDDLERVVDRMAARWKQPRERFRALLADRIGPVTQPLPRAPAERVADVLRDAGVAVEVGQVRVDPPPPAEPAGPDRSPTPYPALEESDRDLEDTAEVVWSPADWLEDPGRLTESDAAAAAALFGPVGAYASATEPSAPPPPMFEEPNRSAREGWLETDRRLAELRQQALESAFVDNDDPGPSPWRRPLLTMLAVAVVVLLALQAGLALWGRGPVDYDDGLAAYRDADFEAARRLWTPVAEAGDPRAQFMLGYLSELGLGQPWSNAGAAPWYRQAAERGHALAQARLASLYARGMGVAHDEATASRWYLAAAQGGLLEAQVELGRRLMLGVGAPRDPVQARLWLQQAAARGHAEAAELAALLTP